MSPNLRRLGAGLRGRWCFLESRGRMPGWPRYRFFEECRAGFRGGHGDPPVQGLFTMPRRTELTDEEVRQP